MAAALEKVGELDEALAALSRGLELDSRSEHIRAELERLRLLKSVRPKKQPPEAAAPPPTAAARPESAEAGGSAGAVALTGAALAREALKLGKCEQAARLLGELIDKSATNAELYADRAAAQPPDARDAPQGGGPRAHRLPRAAGGASQ